MKLKKVGAICNAGGCYYLMDERDAAGEVVGCQRRCDFAIFRRTRNVRKRRVKVCSL